jgi:GNAT superfamily N-acetyltransferase
LNRDAHAAAADLALRERLQSRCAAEILLRPETDADSDFVAHLYADIRAEEMAPVGWPEEAKRAFLLDQYTLQRAHYRQHYANAEFLLIEAANETVGRLYLHRTAAEIRLMDIALLRPRRGQGIGGMLLRALFDIGDADGRAITLHVEPGNPIGRLYGRNGFSLIEERGAYHFMGRPPRLS